MVRFIINSVFLFCLVISLVYGIDSVTISDSYLIEKTKGTSFEKIAWNLQLINKHPQRIKNKTLFMGSSLVQAAIHDSLLSAHGLSAINCATNGNGNEMVYYFLKRMLPYQPKAVYLQLYKTDKTGLHPLTPLLMRPQQLLDAGQTMNLHFVEYLFKRLSFVCDFLLWSAQGAATETYDESPLSNYGQINTDSSDYTAQSYAALDTNALRDYFNFFRPELVNYQLTAERGKTGVYYSGLRLGRKIYYGFRKFNFVYNGACQTDFVRSAFVRCGVYQIPVYRLYVPLVADVKVGGEFDERFYVPSSNRNIRSLKSFEFLDSAKFWNDRAHLSKTGSAVFSLQLLQQKVLDAD